MFGKTQWPSRKPLLVLGGSLLLLAIGGGAALVSAGSSPATISACVNNASGELKIVGSSTTQCRGNESLLTWNQQGPPGPAGATVLSGTSAPTNQGNVGDFYLDTSTETLYGPKTSSGWPSSGTSLVGPQGAAGQDGTNGTNGNTILNGTSAPTDQGNVGDFYLDTSTETLYGPKTSSGWPSSGTSLVGPAGPAGTASFLTAPGTTTYIVPNGVTQLIVSLKGGGGGGGGSFGGDAGSGGGAGASVRALVSVTPGESLTVTVGSGGTSDSQSTGSGVLSPNFSVFVAAYGGGSGNTNGAGGAGGAYTADGVVVLNAHDGAAGASPTAAQCGSTGAGMGGDGGGIPDSAGAGGAGANGSCSASESQSGNPGVSGENGYVEIQQAMP